MHFKPDIFRAETTAAIWHSVNVGSGCLVSGAATMIVGIVVKFVSSFEKKSFTGANKLVAHERQLATNRCDRYRKFVLFYT